MNDINIGQTIKKFRQRKEISCRQLALMAEITPSMMTQIEKGQANPSINSLKAIAEALNTPLYALFSEENSKESLVVRKNERRKMGYEDDPEIQYELLMPSGSGIEFCKMRLAPHMTSASKMYSHSGEEVSIVVSGTATIYLDEDVYVLQEGDSIRIPSSQRHRWENKTDNTVEVIFAVTPPTF